MGHGAVAAAAMREEGVNRWSTVRYFHAESEKEVPVLTTLENRRHNSASHVSLSVRTCEIRGACQFISAYTRASARTLTDQDYACVGNDP